MNGKITKYGELYIIKENGEIIGKTCPFSRNGTYRYENGEEIDRTTSCGDWCSLFEEPTATYNNSGKKDITVTLKLCKKTLEFKEFTDERENG